MGSPTLSKDFDAFGAEVLSELLEENGFILVKHTTWIKPIDDSVAIVIRLSRHYAYYMYLTFETLFYRSLSTNYARYILLAERPFHGALDKYAYLAWMCRNPMRYVQSICFLEVKDNKEVIINALQQLTRMILDEYIKPVTDLQTAIDTDMLFIQQTAHWRELSRGYAYKRYEDGKLVDYSEVNSDMVSTFSLISRDDWYSKIIREAEMSSKRQCFPDESELLIAERRYDQARKIHFYEEPNPHYETTRILLWEQKYDELDAEIDKNEQITREMVNRLINRSNKRKSR